MKHCLVVTCMLVLGLALVAEQAQARGPRGGRGFSGPSPRGFSPPSRPGTPNFSPSGPSRLTNGTQVLQPGQSVRNPGFQPGQLNTGNVRPGQFGQGQFGPGNFGPGSANLPGQRPTQQQVNDFLKLPQQPQQIRNEFATGQRTPGERQQQFHDNRSDLAQQRHEWANDLRNNVADAYDDLFTPAWYAQHPTAWQITHPHADAWATATFAAATAWLGWAAAPPVYYGDTVVYQEGNVYLDGQAVATGEEYAQQAEQIAQANQQVTDDQSEWLPLGVYALVREPGDEPTSMLQLAVSKEGIIKGSYYSTLGGNVTLLQGAVDRDSQRAAWRIGTTNGTVMETGLSNLTEDEAPLLVHLEGDRHQQWWLVRVPGQQQ